MRTPGGGIAPQAAVDGDGVVHLVFFKAADAGSGDLFYVRSRDGGATFSAPLRVNSQPGSAMAARHPRLALGRGGRVHVAWNGATGARPRGPLNPDQPADSPHNGTPLLYARLDDRGEAFEEQRNVMRRTYALDGGGAVAADADGNVYVVWHAAADGLPKGEPGRRVWVARSADDGKTFDEETQASDQPTGACGCCHVMAHAGARGALLVLFRGAETGVDRDMYLLSSADRGSTFRAAEIDTWRTGTCPMSAAALAATPAGVVAGWETQGRVIFGTVDRDRASVADRAPAPGEKAVQKMPVVAVNARGERVHAWTEGMAWKRGGSVAWQVVGADGRAAGPVGRAEGVPADGAAAVFARPDGDFVIVY